MDKDLLHDAVQLAASQTIANAISMQRSSSTVNPAKQTELVKTYYYRLSSEVHHGSFDQNQ